MRDAAERGLRLIGYDRPGYGESPPQPGRTVADCTADVRAICGELGIDRMAKWGHSGGGPRLFLTDEAGPVMQPLIARTYAALATRSAARSHSTPRCSEPSSENRLITRTTSSPSVFS